MIAMSTVSNENCAVTLPGMNILEYIRHATIVLWFFTNAFCLVVRLLFVWL